MPSFLDFVSKYLKSFGATVKAFGHKFAVLSGHFVAGSLCDTLGHGLIIADFSIRPALQKDMSQRSPFRLERCTIDDVLVLVSHGLRC